MTRVRLSHSPGFWRRYHGPIRKSGANVELDVYAFLTTTPNPLVAMINHERMPVLLSKPEGFDQWLNGTPKEALELAREYPPELMRIVREGLDKEDTWLEAA
jgi:putative SOS response-associated peptidase YedK